MGPLRGALTWGPSRGPSMGVSYAPSFSFQALEATKQPHNLHPFTSGVLTLLTSELVAVL